MEFLKIPLFGLFSSEIMLSAKVCVSVTVCVHYLSQPFGSPWLLPLAFPVMPVHCTRQRVVCKSDWGHLWADPDWNWQIHKQYNHSELQQNDFVHHKRLLFCVYWWPMLWHKCHWIPWYYKISKHSCKLPLILHGSEVRCCKYSTMILVHKIWNHRADLSAANPWCKSPVLSHL